MRIAVVGAGVMGANHARVASRTAGIELAAIIDQDAERRLSLARDFDAPSFGSVTEALRGARFEAAVVATPTQFHHEVGCELIEHGIHVLIEKPIALNEEQGEDLGRRAAAAGVVLTVGHIERFNAAVRELMRSVEKPIHLDIVRAGPFTPRVLDNVVVDLMIHDLDLARVIAKSEVTKVSSVLQSARSSSPDLAVALLEFENGVTASITASRIGQQKVRQISVTELEAVTVADLIRQDLQIHRMQHVEYISGSGARIRQSGVVEIPYIEQRGEPLMEELRAFAAAVAGTAAPVVTASDAVAAVRLAHQVLAV